MFYNSDYISDFVHHIQDTEKRRREEAVERLSQWREAEVVNQQLKTQLQSYEKDYHNKTR